MIDTTRHEFGKPIRFDNDPNVSANEMVTKFVKLKHYYRNDLSRLTEGHGDARRYYCSDDCAYIFDVKYLRSILRSIEDNADGKGCMILFHGLRREKEDEGPYGRPTIIATAYGLGEDSAGKTILEHLPLTVTMNGAVEDVNIECDGIEHPGDGSSPGATKNFSGADDKVNETTTEDEWIPVVLERRDDPTDYAIKHTITEDDLKHWKL